MFTVGHRKGQKGEPLKLHFADARKAYFNGRPDRSLYLRLPRELGLPPNVLGRLVRCCYGTRDAGSIWETFYTDSLISMGFLQGRSSPCVFYHPTWDVQVVVHGDDFTALGTSTSLDEHERGLQECFDVKLRGRLGEDDGDLREIRVLNRILRVTPSGLTWEADPRHCELLMRSLNLESSRHISTPGVRWVEDLEHGPSENETPPSHVASQEETYVDSAVCSIVDGRSPMPKIVRRIVDGEERPVEVHLRFDTCPQIIEVQPYAECYDHHPRSFVFAGPVGSPAYQLLSSTQDPFTGRDHLLVRKILSQNQRC